MDPSKTTTTAHHGAQVLVGRESSVNVRPQGYEQLLPIVCARPQGKRRNIPGRENRLVGGV